MALKFKDLAEYYLQSKGPNGTLSPEDITDFVNKRADPWELFQQRTNKIPVVSDYETPGINADFSKTKDGNQYILPSNNESSLMGLLNFLSMSPKDRAGFFVHENAHVNDPRLNKSKMWSSPNAGYITQGGLSGGVLQRERPAIQAENNWRNS